MKLGVCVLVLVVIFCCRSLVLVGFGVVVCGRDGCLCVGVCVEEVDFSNLV